MAHADLEKGNVRLTQAVENLREDPTREENREEVCMETRAVFGMYEEEVYWAGRVDDELKERVLAVFDMATELMASSDDSLLKAVRERRDQIADLDVAKLQRVLAAG